MKDVDIIQEAYEDSVKRIYSVFFEDYTEAPTPSEEDLAEAEFVKAVKAAKRIRDRALTVLP